MVPMRVHRAAFERARARSCLAGAGIDAADGGSDGADADPRRPRLHRRRRGAGEAADEAITSR